MVCSARDALQHRIRAFRTWLAAAIALIGATACDRTDPRAASGPPHTQSAASPPHRVRTVDDQYRQVGSHVAEFGGVFLDGGNPVVVLTKQSALPAARGALNLVFGVRFERRYRDAAWQSTPGRFSYVALADWRDVLTRNALRGVNGISSTGLDQRRNRVRIGITSNPGRRAAIDALGRYGIPPDAVVIEAEDPDRDLHGAPDTGSRKR